MTPIAIVALLGSSWATWEFALSLADSWWDDKAAWGEIVTNLGFTCAAGSGVVTAMYALLALWL